MLVDQGDLNGVRDERIGWACRPPVHSTQTRTSSSPRTAQDPASAHLMRRIAIARESPSSHGYLGSYDVLLVVRWYRTRRSKIGSRVSVAGAHGKHIMFSYIP